MLALAPAVAAEEAFAAAEVWEQGSFPGPSAAAGQLSVHLPAHLGVALEPVQLEGAGTSVLVVADLALAQQVPEVWIEWVLVGPVVLPEKALVDLPVTDHLPSGALMQEALVVLELWTSSCSVHSSSGPSHN